MLHKDTCYAHVSKTGEVGEAHRQPTLNKAKPPQDSGYATGAYNADGGYL